MKSDSKGKNRKIAANGLRVLGILIAGNMLMGTHCATENSARDGNGRKTTKTKIHRNDAPVNAQGQTPR